MIQFRELIRRLQAENVEFVIVGGVAATIHGVMEPTRDLDVCIRPTVETWARVARVLEGINPRYALTPDRRPFTPRVEDLRNFRNLYALTDLGRIDSSARSPHSVTSIASPQMRCSSRSTGAQFASSRSTIC